MTAMCETCGVTEATYQRARQMLTQSAWATLYRARGIDPSYYGVDEPADYQKPGIADVIETYHCAHPCGRGLAKDELLEWFERRELERADEREAAVRAGC